MGPVDAVCIAYVVDGPAFCPGWRARGDSGPVPAVQSGQQPFMRKVVRIAGDVHSAFAGPGAGRHAGGQAQRLRHHRQPPIQL